MSYLVLLSFGKEQTDRASPLGYTDCDRVQKLFNESPWHVTTHPLVYCSYTGYHDLHTRGPNAIMWPHLAFPQPFHTRRHPPYICFGYATNVWKYVSIVDSSARFGCPEHDIYILWVLSSRFAYPPTNKLRYLRYMEVGGARPRHTF